MAVEEHANATPVASEMVPLLRKWSLALVRHLLEVEPLDRLPLSPEEMEILATATALDIKPKRPFLWRFGIPTPMFPKRRKKRNKLRQNPEVWDRRVKNHAALQLQEDDDLFVADFWRPIAQAAWGDPIFVSKMNQAMQHYWRSRSLFPQGIMPLCHVQPNTFWLLLFIHANTQEETSPQLLQRLGKITKREALIPGWARFWDQWLLWRLLELYPNARPRMGKRLCSMLDYLPFFKIAAAQEQEKKEASKLKRFLQRIKQLLFALLPGFAPKVQHQLAHRGWQRDMPPFLYNHHSPRKRRKE
jgi:hypothetical protein